MAQSACELKPVRTPAARPRKPCRADLEGAIYDAAPDLTSLAIEGLEEKSASGFVALDKLMTAPALPIRSCAGIQGAD
jgi:hypothetical protein